MCFDKRFEKRMRNEFLSHHARLLATREELLLGWHSEVRSNEFMEDCTLVRAYSSLVECVQLN